MARQETHTSIGDKVMRAFSLLDYRQLGRAQEIRTRPAPEKPRKEKLETVEDFIQRARELNMRRVAIEIINSEPSDEHPTQGLTLTVKQVDGGAILSFNNLEKRYGNLPNFRAKTFLAAVLARDLIESAEFDGGRHISVDIIDAPRYGMDPISPSIIEREAAVMRATGITPFPISVTQNKT